METKRRFGRAGELEITIDSVRVGDGGTATLRASSQEGENQMHGGRLAATVAASPVLVWVKGKNVQFERGVETTAYIRGNIPVDEARLRDRYRGSVTPTEPVQSSATASGLTNRDIIKMKNAGLSDDVILAKIRTSETDFRTGPQDLIDLKGLGVSDPIIQAMVQKVRH